MNKQEIPIPSTLRVADVASAYGALLVANWRSLGVLVGLGWAGFALVAGLEMALPGESAPQLLFGLVSLALLPAGVLVGAVAHLCLWREIVDWRAALGVGLQAFASVVLILLISRLLVGLGLFLVLPGLAAMILFSLAATIQLAERPGVAASLQSSVTRLWPVFWPVLLAYGIFLLSLVAGTLAAMLVGLFIMVFLPEPAQSPFILAGFSAIFTVLHTAFATAVYLVMRYGPPPK